MYHRLIEHKLMIFFMIYFLARVGSLRQAKYA